MKRSLGFIQGLGNARVKFLTDECQIHTAEDLIYLFPFRYIDRNLQSNTPIKIDEYQTFIVTVKSKYIIRAARSRFCLHCQTEKQQNIDLIWFYGTNYLPNIFQKEMKLIVSGKVQMFRNLQVMHPDFEIIHKEDEQDFIHTGRIIPIYKTNEMMKKKKLDSRGLRKLIFSALFGDTLHTTEIIPQHIRSQRKNLLSRKDALQAMHYPKTQMQLKQAQFTLKYEELYAFNILMQKKRELRKTYKRYFYPHKFTKSDFYKKLISDLPFKLEDSQLDAIRTILKDTELPFPSSNLLQGDVGSGKTIVALCVAMHYCEGDIQVAFLAPTEILARQHFLTISQYLGFQFANHIELLTSGDKKKIRDEKLNRIAMGETKIIVGTHSLMEEKVIFHKMGLAIIDEQHRFGVKQKDKLRMKGNNPDILAMTATPIPRTLCLTEFADMSLILMKSSRQRMRPKMETFWFKEKDRARLYKAIYNHVQKKEQCYIVYPLVNESETIDLKTAVEAYEQLSKGVFGDFNLALLHGQMSSKEKSEIMLNFKNHEIDILITTSIIEVGIDVANATIIVIEHAERFGIAQLHQLRGRVGRGTLSGFCALVSEGPTPESQTRIEALLASTDGFYLSEIDMKLRGSGEILGLKQHGSSGLKLVDLNEDKELIENVRQDIELYQNEIKDTMTEVQYFIQKHFPTNLSALFPN